MAVIENAFETKGTKLYFVDSTGLQVLSVSCPTGVTGVAGGTKDQIDTTCLDETGDVRTSIGGFADATEVSVPFILYDGDASHQDLFTLKTSGEVVAWMLALSDDTTAPTLASDGLEPPTNRTTFSWDGYVSNLTIDAAINDVVRGTLTVKPSGSTTPHWPA
jgi:hypothetical protein